MKYKQWVNLKYHHFLSQLILFHQSLPILFIWLRAVIADQFPIWEQLLKNNELQIATGPPGSHYMVKDGHIFAQNVHIHDRAGIRINYSLPVSMTMYEVLFDPYLKNRLVLQTHKKAVV